MANQAPQDVLLSTVLTRYMAQHGGTIASKATASRAVDLWREWWPATTTVAEVGIGQQEDFLGWLRGKEYSEGYARRVLGVGKSALNRAWKRGEIAQVPFVELPPIGEAYPHYASREQVVRLLNTPMPEHLWALLLIRLCTGCRGDAAQSSPSGGPHRCAIDRNRDASAACRNELRRIVKRHEKQASTRTPGE